MSDSTAGPERPAPVSGAPRPTAPGPRPPAPGPPPPRPAAYGPAAPEPTTEQEPAPAPEPPPGPGTAAPAPGTADGEAPGPASAVPGPAHGTAVDDPAAAGVRTATGDERPAAATGEEPAREYDPAAPAPLGVERAPTGHAEVDAQLQRLADTDHLATDGHVEVYEDVHRGLRDALTALDTRPGPPAPPPRPGGFDTRS